jgi:hypothetical protein
MLGLEGCVGELEHRTVQVFGLVVDFLRLPAGLSLKFFQDTPEIIFSRGWFHREPILGEPASCCVVDNAP